MRNFESLSWGSSHEVGKEDLKGMVGSKKKEKRKIKKEQKIYPKFLVIFKEVEDSGRRWYTC